MAANVVCIFSKGFISQLSSAAQPNDVYAWWWWWWWCVTMATNVIT